MGENMLSTDCTGNSTLPSLLTGASLNDNANQARTSAAIVIFMRRVNRRRQDSLFQARNQV